MGQFVDERTCMFKEWAGGRLGYRGELPGVGFESVCKDAGGGIDKLRCGPFDHNEYGAAALQKRRSIAVDNAFHRLSSVSSRPVSVSILK